MPSLATMMLLMASGTDVPAARKTTPITTLLMWASFPNSVAQYTSSHESRPIHRQDAMKVATNQLCHRGSAQLGMVYVKAIVHGALAYQRPDSIAVVRERFGPCSCSPCCLLLLLSVDTCAAMPALFATATRWSGFC